MKKILTLLFLVITVQVLAQTYPITGITISLPANPDANTANWGSGAALLTITAASKLNNGKLDGRVQESKILVSIKKDGAKVCGSYTNNSSPASNFNTLTKVWSGNNATSLLGQSCVLPPGEYELTVQFFGPGIAGLVPLSEEKSRPFSIRVEEQQAYQPPQAITPANGTLLSETDLKKPITFRWTPVIPRPKETVTYRLKVWQLMQGQSGTQAMSANQPLITKDVDNITQTVINNLVSGPCMPPYLCDFIWNVQALNREGKPIGGNKGTSDANTFEVGNDNLKSLPGNNNPVVVDTGTAAIGDTIRAGQDGEFKIAVTQITTETDGSLTGKGTVTVDWFSTNIAVEFSKIRIDSTKRLTAGGIVTEKSTGVNYIQAWLTSNLTAAAATIPLDGVLNWSNNQVDNVMSWVNNNNFGLPDFHYQSNIPSPPIPANSLKMPFGIKFNNPDDTLMITEMVFKPNDSKINFLVRKLFTKGANDYKLGFSGKYFLLHPRYIDFTTGRVELVQDIDVPSPKMKFTFKKGTANSGCYIAWDSTGVKNISLGLEVKFTREWLLPVSTSTVPVPPPTDSVKAIISGNGTSMRDILLTGSLPHCEIVGTNGFKFLADSISLDLSDVRNPGSIHFPSNYPNDSTVTWQGFYIKSFGLTLPETWKTGTNLNPPNVSASNIIIDDMGLTAKIKAVNIFDLQSGRVADLSASLDTIEVSIISSSLVSGTAKGKLVLPISEVTAQNSLKYTATFAQVASTNNFQIVIVPLGPIDADILKGKMTLSPTSNILAVISPTAKTLSINLNGTFKWDSPNLSASPISTGTSAPTRATGIKGIKMEMGFENLGLNYTNISNTNTLTFNPGTWSFASPPKFLANFPVTIKNIYYKSLTKVSPELVRGALMIDIVANLTEDIGGTTTVGAAFAIEYQSSQSGLKKFEPKFKGVFIEKIEVHANLPAVKIDGSISFRENHPVFGDGFLGELTVDFTSVGVKAMALVEFGNTNHLHSSLYRYWRVEADVLLPPPGVPFLTGLAFRGFGGGAYYNMEATLGSSTKTPSGKKFTFTPKKSTFGLKVAATIATTPKEETFNADVALTAQFSKAQGLVLIAFTGDFYVAAGLETSKRAKAKINGDVSVSYNFPDKHFNLSASVNVNAPPISTPSPANLVLDINGKTNKWFFKFGEPTTNPSSLVNVDVSVLGVTAHLYEYLMFGNDITPPSGFTQKFKDGYHTALGGDPGIAVTTAGVTNSNTATGKGLALGVGFEFNKVVDFDLVGSYKASLALGAGAELNLAFAEYIGQNCENPSERIGINGWQATGAIGFYAYVAASVKEGSSTWNIANIKAGGWLQGKFPNPVYVAGAVQGSVKIGHFTTWTHSLGDWTCKPNYPWTCSWEPCVHPQNHYLVNTSFNKSFDYGIDCGTSSALTGAAVAQGDAAEDQKQLLIQYVNPTQQYDFPILSPLAVQYGLIPNKVFDVSEQQSDGSIKNRTFKMVVTTNLKIRNDDGSFTNQLIKKNENNLGEFLYTVIVPGVINTSTALLGTQVKVPAVINTSTANTIPTLNTFNTIGKFNTISYPLPPPTNTYNNLPPEPPAIKNNLTVNKNYVFTVIATLKEYVNNGWIDAKNKNNITVTHMITKNFRTGPMVIAVSTSAPKK